jgi:hypothetical protein
MTSSLFGVDHGVQGIDADADAGEQPAMDRPVFRMLTGSPGHVRVAGAFRVAGPHQGRYQRDSPYRAERYGVAYSAA